MKSNNIKKALEDLVEQATDVVAWHMNRYGAEEIRITASNVLAYINQLEEKTESLEKENQQLKFEVEGLNNECRETRRDLLNEIIRLEDQLETAKSDAIEEFAERLKEHFEAQRGHISEHYGLRSYWEDKYFYDYEIEDEIDKFVKEMEDE